MIRKVFSTRRIIGVARRDDLGRRPGTITASLGVPVECLRIAANAEFPSVARPEAEAAARILLRLV